MQLAKWSAALAIASAPWAVAQDAEAPLQFSGEVLTRVEASQPWLLNRVRLNAAWQLNTQAAIHAELVDARSNDGAINRLDVRLAFLETRFRPNWMLRAGRQPISLGDERLVGFDSRWNPVPPVFDAVSLKHERNGVELGAFGAMIVGIDATRVDGPSPRRVIAGATATLAIRDSSISPYLLYSAGRGDGSRATAGALLSGGWRERFDYSFEVALQRRGEWAAHLELGRKLPRGVRLWIEQNLASGAPRLFDDLYPAAYNAFGLQDPFAWRDIRFSGAGGEFATERLRLSATFRHYWTAGGQNLGGHWIAAAEYEVGRHVAIAGAVEGYSGAGRHACDLHAVPIAKPFASVSYRF